MFPAGTRSHDAKTIERIRSAMGEGRVNSESGRQDLSICIFSSRDLQRGRHRREGTETASHGKNPEHLPEFPKFFLTVSTGRDSLLLMRSSLWFNKFITPKTIESGLRRSKHLGNC
ncbi:hypothetical protein TNCV_1890991 [Trichonephila clavipes]|nr:hypothetical protein TNCV_1890991 [Trichonephila clavipes]